MKQFEYQDADRRGTLRRLDYTGIRGARKYAEVYLPWGYDADPGRRYDILYLMHGGGGNPDAWLDCCPVKNMLDRSFADGAAEPMIVVFPSYYADGPKRTPGEIDADWERRSVFDFQQELKEALLPAVEGVFRGFAEGAGPEALKKARAHRGFGGFSMGGVNTWAAFSQSLDYFSVFLPLSGDSWALGPMGGSEQPGATADLLRRNVLDAGFGAEDFAVYAATGTEDIAYPNLTPQIEAMKARDDVFRFSEDFARGNLHYLVGEGMAHTYEAVNQYVYNYLPYLFRG